MSEYGSDFSVVDTGYSLPVKIGFYVFMFVILCTLIYFLYTTFWKGTAETSKEVVEEEEESDTENDDDDESDRNEEEIIQRLEKRLP